MPGMEKLLNGIMKFRGTIRNDLVQQFQRVKDNPNPTCLFFTCIDSRMLPSRFTQTNVGDMYIVRNVGNVIPHSHMYDRLHEHGIVTTEPAAMDLACVTGSIRHVVVCGHSDCLAMKTLSGIHDECCVESKDTHIQTFLRKNGQSTMEKFDLHKQSMLSSLTFQGETPRHNFEAYIDPDDKFQMVDKLSQINCLQQLQNISSWGFLRSKLENNEVRLHAMWFDIYTGDHYMFSRTRKRFVEISEENLEHLLVDSL